MPMILPEIIVHRFEEKFIVWLIEDMFEVRKSNPVSSDGQLDQVRSFLVVEVINNFGLPHGGPLGRVRPSTSSPGYSVCLPGAGSRCLLSPGPRLLLNPWSVALEVDSYDGL